MKIRSLLAKRIENQDYIPGVSSLDDWLNNDWVEIRVGKSTVRVFPIRPIRAALQKHDIHHLLTEYKTNWKGELELAAWELSSGGCRYNFLFWADRITFFLVGLLICPRNTLRAWGHGSKCRNLYNYNKNISELLEVDDTKLKELLFLNE